MTPQEAYKELTPRNAYEKAFFEDKRSPELEAMILSDPWYSYRYARNIIEDRWEEAEDVIMNDPQASFHYASDIIKGKLPTKMHNRMLLYSIEKSSGLDPESKWVKRYFEYIK